MIRLQQESDQKLKKVEDHMSVKGPGIQEVFLNHLRTNKIMITLFLVNGVKLQGIITSFDNFCISLKREQHSQLVYKHAISTVMPLSQIHLFEKESKDTEAEIEIEALE